MRCSMLSATFDDLSCALFVLTRYVGTNFIAHSVCLCVQHWFGRHCTTTMFGADTALRPKLQTTGGTDEVRSHAWCLVFITIYIITLYPVFLCYFATVVGRRVGRTLR